MPKTRALAKARPNGWPIELEQMGDDEPSYAVYEWDEEGYRDDGVEFDADLRSAQDYFASRVQELAETPNWRLQARYDAEHGTENGYAPFNRREQ